MTRSLVLGLLVGVVGFFASEAYAQSRMIPHITRPNSGFHTTLTFQNQTGRATTCTLLPYDESGKALATVRLRLAPETSITHTIPELFPEQRPSHLMIEGTGFLGSAAYGVASETASYAHVAESVADATRYRFFPGQWERVFDGLAIVNAGTEPSTIWVVHKLPDGTPLRAIPVANDLAPKAKTLFVLGGPETRPFEAVTDSFFEVYANQPIGLTALRGTTDTNSHLWSNPTFPISRSTTKRDEVGVWFVEDGSLYDAYEAMGYAVAQDRLWQLSLYRFRSRGRLAEVFGQELLDSDIFTRKTTYSEAEYQQEFAALDTESQELIRGYVHGINRHIAEVNHQAQLRPFELVAAGLNQLEPWSVTDVLAWQVTLMRSFDPHGGIWFGQLNNAALLQALGEAFPQQAQAMFDDMRWVTDPNAPAMVQGSSPESKTHPKTEHLDLGSGIDFITVAQKVRNRALAGFEALDQVNANTKMGSYAWVVAGQKTASGNPILYSGPQMGFEVPSIVAEGSIRTKDIDVSGMVVPGMPGIIIGRTPHHAWGFMTGAGHTLDLYLEDELPATPHRTELIKVKDGADVTVPIYRTAHGPVVEEDPVISFNYSQTRDELSAVRWMLDMAKAQDKEAFGSSLEGMGINLHVCYADREGNIAYWMGGQIPVRPEGEFRLPQGAVAAPLEYDRDITYPIISDSNPDNGFYGGWNNKPYADYPNAPLGTAELNGHFHPAHVIQDYLAEHNQLSFEEVRDLAERISVSGDLLDSGHHWKVIGPIFSQIVAAEDQEAFDAAIVLLNEWDGQKVVGGPSTWSTSTEGSEGMWLMSGWLNRVLELTFDDELSVLGEGFEDAIEEEVGFNMLLHGLHPDSALPFQYDWFTNLADPSAPQTANDIIVQALQDTLDAFGPRPWNFAFDPSIEYDHPFLDVIHEHPLRDRSTYAQCVELDDEGPVRIESMFPLGTSGFILGIDDEGQAITADHFFSMTPYFDHFIHRPFPTFR